MLSECCSLAFIPLLAFLVELELMRKDLRISECCPRDSEESETEGYTKFLGFFFSFNFTVVTVWKFGVKPSTLTQTADDGEEKWNIFLSSQVVYDPSYFSWGFIGDAVLVLIEFWEWACKDWSSFPHCVVSAGGMRVEAPLCLHIKKQINRPMMPVLGRREKSNRKAAREYWV